MSAMTLQEAMQQAGNSYNGGDLAAAERFCRAILAKHPEFFDALNLIGIIKARTMRVAEAEHYLGRAVVAKPLDADAHNNYGNVLGALARYEAAVASYDRALRIRPRHFDALYNRGNALRALGRLEDALKSYDAALKVQPKRVEAIYSRADVFLKLARFDLALRGFDAVVGILPNLAEAWNDRGNAFQGLSQFSEAVDSYEHCLRLNPDLAEAWFNRGNALQSLTKFKEAHLSYQRALQIRPDYVDAHYNDGNALRGLARSDDALSAYDQAIARHPEHTEARLNRAKTLKDLRRFDEALKSYEWLLERKPNHLEAHVSLGNLLQELRRYQDALECYERALKFGPNRPDIYVNAGNALYELKRFDAALAHSGRALALNPAQAEAHINRGNTLRELMRFDEALESYSSAIALRPDLAEAHVNYGHVLAQLKRFEGASVSYERALALQPDFDWLAGTSLHTRMQLCDWNGFEGRLADLALKLGERRKVVPPFAALALTDSLVSLRQAAEIWVADRFLPGSGSTPFPPRAHHEKIRIGYFSGDFRIHPVSLLTAELIETHDRSRFEVSAFSFGPSTDDEMRRRMERAFDHFIDVRDRSDGDIVQLARDMELDIAIDLGGFTDGGRGGIFALRAAPLQVSYLGFLGTFGAGYMDYLVADRSIIAEPQRKHYTERIIYLPSYQANDSQRVVSERQFTRGELGLPETGFVYCCFNTNYKILPGTFDVWMSILRKVEGSVLMLLAENPTVERNLRNEARARGVAADRLVFGERLSHPDYLARYRAVDLFLDTLPYNAGTTASDALWAGLPVLTCSGASFASRVGASVLHAVGLSDLVVTTRAEYEALAVELAGDSNRMAALRGRLATARHNSILFDTPSFTHSLESAYQRIYDRYQRGLPPDHIDIGAADPD